MLKLHVFSYAVLFLNSELIITAGEENIAPVPIEGQETRKVLSCLITLKVWYWFELLFFSASTWSPIYSVRWTLRQKSPRMSHSDCSKQR